ncbi:hypothetical protein C8E87_4453 [Paractinoplanes brasiliensis]|uniref:Maltokinase N-terminal cap domain-containing protein n=2 Tax=Paractinoplanes brasiliensis TaxID=52695 RepID=A0A4R6JVJ1_9ACTN|nr:hypothetical protein C8E87_4453 [Actinoplanes brasiliensis]GID25805.1 hypothetical protein Abr02nite_07880 [Actinoplanes brasiliensis]
MRRMALIHKATLSPTKVELLAAWLPSRSWYQGAAGAAVERVASYRFDDPEGEVGIETLLVTAGDGPTYQIPLTYRAAPLEDADEWLVGTTEHSVLGLRWVYDGTGDVVYAEALAQALLTGSGQAQEFIEIDGHLEPRQPSMTITTSLINEFAEARAVTAITHVDPANPTVIETDKLTLTIPRILDRAVSHPGAVLFGTWQAEPASVPLAFALPR